MCHIKYIWYTCPLPDRANSIKTLVLKCTVAAPWYQIVLENTMVLKIMCYDINVVLQSTFRSNKSTISHVQIIWFHVQILKVQYHGIQHTNKHGCKYCVKNKSVCVCLNQVRVFFSLWIVKSWELSPQESNNTSLCNNTHTHTHTFQFPLETCGNWPESFLSWAEVSGKDIDLANEVKSGSRTTVVFLSHNNVRYPCVCPWVTVSLLADMIYKSKVWQL